VPSHERQAVLERRIAKVKAQLLALGDLRPGSLSEQYNVCGTPGCQCKADPPRKHGPYYQVSFTWRGRSKSQFVRREHVRTVRQQLRNYELLRGLVGKWIAAALDLSRVRLADAPRSSRAGLPRQRRRPTHQQRKNATP
jgi:hypothetical protein